MAKYKIIKSGVFGSYPLASKTIYNDYEAFIKKYGDFNNIKDIRIKSIYINYDGVRMRGMNLTYQITKLDNSVENFEGVNNHEGGGGNYETITVPDGDRIKKIKGGCGGWIDWVSFEFEKQGASKGYGMVGGGQPFELENPLLYFTQLNWSSKERGIGFYTYNPDIKEINQQEADLKIANADIETKKGIIKKRDDYIIELERNKAQAETDRDQAKADLTKTQTDLTTANNKITQLETDKQQLIKDKATAETERDNAKGDLNNANSKITQLEGEKTTLNNTITNLNTQIANKDTTINDLNGTIKDKDIIIDKLRPLEAKITALEEQLKSKDSELTKRNDAITTLTNEKTKAEGERDQWKEAVNKSNTLIAEKDQQITNLTTEKNTAETKLKEKDGEITNLNSQIATLNQQLTQQGNQTGQSAQYLNKLLTIYKKEITEATQAFYLNDLGLDESDNINPKYWGKGQGDKSYLEKLNELNGEADPEQVIIAFKWVALISATEKAQEISNKWIKSPLAKKLKEGKLKQFESVKKYWDILKEVEPKAENNPLYLKNVIDKDNRDFWKENLNETIKTWQDL